MFICINKKEEQYYSSDTAQHYSKLFGAKAWTYNEGHMSGEVLVEDTDELIRSTCMMHRYFEQDGKIQQTTYNVISITYHKATGVLDADDAQTFFGMAANRETSTELLREIFNKDFPERVADVAVRNITWMLAPVAEYIYNKNKYAYDALTGIFNVDTSSDSSRCKGLFISNAIKMAANLNQVERVVKVNKQCFIDHFAISPFEEMMALADLKAMPTSCREWLESCDWFSSNNRDAARGLFQTITQKEDGNNAIIVMEYLQQALKLQVRKNAWTTERAISKVLNGLKELINGGYNSKKLLEYIIRQSYYNSDFSFPEEEIQMLKDYVSMGKNNGLTCEKFPANVFRAHNMMLNNIKSLKFTEEEEAAFVKHMTNADKYALTQGDYVVVIPHHPRDIVNEGNALSHCVGNYVKAICRGETIIAFLRLKTAPDTSLYTIEIKEGKVMEAKGEFNLEVPDEVTDVIKEIERKWKKLAV